MVRVSDVRPAQHNKYRNLIINVLKGSNKPQKGWGKQNYMYSSVHIELFQSTNLYFQCYV